MAKTFNYKNYCVTVETDTTAYFPSEQSRLRGLYSIWRSTNGMPEKQVYCGHTSKTFASSEVDPMVSAAEAEARAWIDANEGKPWA